MSNTGAMTKFFSIQVRAGIENAGTTAARDLVSSTDSVEVNGSTGTAWVSRDIRDAEYADVFTAARQQLADLEKKLQASGLVPGALDLHVEPHDDRWWQ